MTARRLALGMAVVMAAAFTPAQQVRDAPAQPAPGTATVAGVVLDDSPTPQPLRRALVAITGDDLPVGRSAITDDSGRFSVERLPASRVTITATKAGYVAGAYGAARPGRPGTPAVLRAGETLQATIRLTRTAVVTGVIRDDRGELLPGLRVFAINAAKPEAPAPVARDDSTRTSETDDRGRYRIHGLAPGEYVVAAVATQSTGGDVTRRSAADTDAMLTWLRQRAQTTSPASRAEPINSSAPVVPAPFYYPGTSVLRSAARIKVGPGDVRDGLDFVVMPVPVTTIEGAVVAEGGLPASVELSITPLDSLRFFALGGGVPQLTQRPGTDGRFKYSTILPGRYVIGARGSPIAPSGGRGASEGIAGLGRGGNLPETMYAVEEVEVAGQPLTAVTVMLRRGSRVTGKVVVDAMPGAALDLSTATVTVQPPPDIGGAGSSGSTMLGNMFGRPAAVTVKSDGSFEIVGVAPGDYTLQLTLPPAAGQTWWLRSALVDSRDLLDTGLAVTSGADFTELLLTATNRRSEIGGVLQASTGLPATDYFVIVMPANAAMWRARSRRVKATRPASDGSFSFMDLPTGEYLLVTLTDVEPNEWQKPEFLAAIAPAGVKVSLAEGERKRQDLRIGGR